MSAYSGEVVDFGDALHAPTVSSNPVLSTADLKGMVCRALAQILQNQGIMPLSYFGMPWATTSIEVTRDNKIRVGVLRKAVEKLGKDLGVGTVRIRAALDLPTPLGAAAIRDARARVAAALARVFKI